MYKLYLCIFLFTIFLSAYFIGIRQGKSQCKEDFAMTFSQKILQKQAEKVEKIGEINAKVFHTGVNDIRDILRQKYTIAE